METRGKQLNAPLFPQVAINCRVNSGMLPHYSGTGRKPAVRRRPSVPPGAPVSSHRLAWGGKVLGWSMILLAFSMVLGCNGESGADSVSLPPFVTQLGAGAAIVAAYGMMRSGPRATAAASSPMNVDSGEKNHCHRSPPPSQLNCPAHSHTHSLPPPTHLSCRCDSFLCVGGGGGGGHAHGVALRVSGDIGRPRVQCRGLDLQYSFIFLRPHAPCPNAPHPGA